MSIIYGLIHFSSNEIGSDLKTMKAALASVKADHSGEWSEQNAGIGNLLRYNTPESFYENLPFVQNDKIISSSSRIDNRRELFDLLNIPENLIGELPDSIIILKAFEKWEKNCVKYIEGDWAFAIWDKTKQELFIARDHFGNTGIFYHHSASLFAFSSSIKGILAIPQVPLSINELSVAGILSGRNPEDGATVYESVFEIQRGHTLTLKNGKITKSRYWFPEEIAELTYTSADDYTDHFLELYQNAIDSRMRIVGKIGSTLSGGLDSGSISALVARKLQENAIRLKAYTSVPAYDVSSLVRKTRFGDETHYAQSTADFSRNIDINFISGEKISIIEGVRRHLEIHEAPPVSASNAFWMYELFQKAKEDGVRSLFIGQAGNATISWKGIAAPYALADLLRGRTHLSRIQVLREILKQFVPSFLLNQPEKIRTVDFFHYSAISTELARRTNLEKLLETDRIEARKNITGLQQRCFMIHPRRSSIGSVWQQNGYAFDMEMVDPTRDKKLTEYCFSIPNRMFVENGLDRMMIRKSMVGILPDNVRLNQRTGSQSADSQYRVQNNFTEIEQIIRTFELSDVIPYYLNVGKMKELALKIRHSVDIAYQIECDAVLMKGIGVGLFLEKQLKQ